MCQPSRFKAGARARLLAGAVLVFVFMIAGCCPPLLTTGTTGKNCACANTEKADLAFPKDFHTHAVHQTPAKRLQ